MEGFSGAPDGSRKALWEDCSVSSPHSQCARTWIPFGIYLATSTAWGMGTPRMAGSKISPTFLRKVCVPFLLLAYVGIPLLAGWLLSEIVDFLTFDLLGIVSHFPLAIAGFIASPFLFLSAIHAYLSDGITMPGKYAVFYYRQKKFGHA